MRTVQFVHHNITFFARLFARTQHERHVLRRELRLSHIDSNQAVVVQARFDNAARRLHADGAFVGQPVLRYEFNKAARAVAALFHFAPVGIEDAVTEIDTRGVGFFHQQQLIEADTRVSVCPRLNLRGIGAEGLARSVNDHKVVAQTVHFAEFQCCHDDSLIGYREVQAAFDEKAACTLSFI